MLFRYASYWSRETVVFSQEGWVRLKNPNTPSTWAQAAAIDDLKLHLDLAVWD
jgi:hypothetical protein